MDYRFIGKSNMNIHNMLIFLKGVGVIFVCSLKDKTKLKFLVNENLENIRAIALNPGTGEMFWSIWEFSNSVGKIGLIETAWMDGTNRKTLVNQGLYWPNGLTIDYENNQLYWCDGFYLKIERINLDGTNRKVSLFNIKQKLFVKTE